jgi:hypothetical protein
MIKRDRDKAEGEEPTTYLGLAMAASDAGGRFSTEKPSVVGSTAVPPALPASGPWAGDPVGNEEPLNFSIEELPALGGASEPLRCVEVSTPLDGEGSAEDRTDGEQR